MADHDHDTEEKKKEKEKEKEKKNIPFDIIINILSRVPANFLIRFRCVCKLWCSLTYDPHFIDLHLKHARKVSSPCIVILSQYEQSGEICLTMLDEAWKPKCRFRISSSPSYSYMTLSCDGLLCLYNNNTDLVQLCNPTTRELLTLPKPTTAEDTSFYARYYFGFLPATKEYKVVRIFSYDPKLEINGIGCEVFTLGTGFWRQIGNIDYLLVGRGITLNGVMYWMKFPDTIISLDLKAEQFIPISAPDSESYKNKMHEPMSLLELEGSVCLAVSPRDAQMPMDIWMLKDYTKHVWSHKHRILVHTRLELRWYATPKLIEKGKILFKLYQRLCYHDLESMSENCEKVYHDVYMIDANVHVESLVSLANYRRRLLCL